MADGSFIYSKTDIQVPGVIPLAITRTYVSNIAYNGPMGDNFDFNYNRSLELQSGAAFYHTGLGYKIQLNYTGGTTTAAQSVNSPIHLSMSKLPDSEAIVVIRGSVPSGSTSPVFTGGSSAGCYLITDPHGNKDYFDTSGNLIESTDRNSNTLFYVRDDVGRLLAVFDAVHNTYLLFTLDSNGRIIDVTDSFGRVIQYSYDTDFNLTTVTYPATADFPLGTTNTYSYDGDNRMTGVADGNAHTLISNTYGDPGTATEYDLATQTTNGGTTNFDYSVLNKIKVTDAKGYVTEYFNDASGNVIEKLVHTAGLHASDPATYETDWAYDSNFQLLSATYPDHNKTAWTYDDYGDVLTVTKSAPSGTTVDATKGTQSLSSETQYSYETRFHQVETVTDPNLFVTSFDYGTATSNPAGNLLSITYPTTVAGTAKTEFTYNSVGQTLTSSSLAPDSSHIVTQNTYVTTPDSTHPLKGLLLSTIQDYGSGKLNAETDLGYDSYAHVASVENPNRQTTTITTNAFDEVTEIDSPTVGSSPSEVVRNCYDAAGNLIVTQRNLGTTQWQKAETVYNSYNQASETHAYTNATSYLTTSYGYDLNGNQTSVTDPLSHSTSIAYDERDMPYKKTDALGKITLTDFDGNGNTTKLTDELGNVTSYDYDGLDKVEKKIFADSSYQTWIYDAGGRNTSRRTTAGNTISVTYDNRNELLTEDYGSTITNAYDVLGRLVTATEGGTSLTYLYDNLGRVTSFTDQVGHASAYSYDLDGNRLSAAYPTGVTANYAYDALDRLSTLKDVSNNLLATYTYDTLDRVSQIALGNGTTVTPSFDLINRMNSVNNALSSVNRNYSYVYDDACRITSITEPRGTIEIDSYSDRNEVKGITEPTGSPFADQSFNYDAGFNRANWTLGTTTTNYTPNNLNQYSTVSGSTAPSWNTDGGLASFGGNTYTYDHLGRLTQVSNSGGLTLYSYDPLGRRTKKVHYLNTTPPYEVGPGSETDFHYDGGAVAVEYHVGIATWTYYGGLLRTGGGHNQYYYRDGQGSVSAVSDNSGSVLETYEYNAQGQVQVANGSGTVLSSTGIDNDMLYAGYQYDLESGNYFCNARYYNPTLGRFISRDPLGGAEFSQGTNLYAYCGNNCANELDPSGMGGHWESNRHMGDEEKDWVADPVSATPNGGLTRAKPTWYNPKTWNWSLLGSAFKFKLGFEAGLGANVNVFGYKLRGGGELALGAVGNFGTDANHSKGIFLDADIGIVASTPEVLAGLGATYSPEITFSDTGNYTGNTCTPQAVFGVEGGPLNYDTTSATSIGAGVDADWISGGASVDCAVVGRATGL